MRISGLQDLRESFHVLFISYKGEMEKKDNPLTRWPVRADRHYVPPDAAPCKGAVQLGTRDLNLITRQMIRKTHNDKYSVFKTGWRDGFTL